MELGALKEFVGGLRTAGQAINGELAAVPTTRAWDGKDAVVEDEEEFDLSDIMGEEL